jgi:hypothetical protein
VLDEGERQEDMAGGWVGLEEKVRPDGRRAGHGQGQDPVERRHAREAPVQEDERAQRPLADRGPQHETGDDEEDVDAGRADVEVAPGPAVGVIEHHHQGRDGAQVLDRQ